MLILVDVATGGESVLFREPSPTGLAILGFKSEGIYVTVPGTSKIGDVPPPPDRLGLHLVDPRTGAERRLPAGSVDDRFLSSSALWTWESGSGIGWPHLIRVDIASGSRETWFVADQTWANLIALDLSGAPIVEEFGGAVRIEDGPVLQEMWRVWAPSAGQMFYSMSYNYTSGNPLHDQVQVDRHGVWFGSTTGVYLYSAEGFTKLADTPGYPLGDCG